MNHTEAGTLTARVIAVINIFPYGTIEVGETMTVEGFIEDQDAIEMRLDKPHPKLPHTWDNTIWIQPGLTTWTDCLEWPDGSSLETVYAGLSETTSPAGVP
jgi:hypothetical protein